MGQSPTRLYPAALSSWQSLYQSVYRLHYHIRAARRRHHYQRTESLPVRQPVRRANEDVAAGPSCQNRVG